MTSAIKNTLDPAEVEKFSRIADEWWDPTGKFRPLHRINPVRIAYIRDRLCQHFRRDPGLAKPLEGLRLLDIGCGGGLLCEPMARLGAEVTGIDASEKNIAVAQLHAAQSNLDISYLATTVEALAQEDREFDVILTMEVVEHVADVETFLSQSCRLLHPGGAMLLSTINRTLKAYALAIVGAEYILRWLPRGTHDWHRFLKPSEIAAHLRPHGVELRDLTGMHFKPLAQEWVLSVDDTGVNYLIFAAKAVTLDHFLPGHPSR